MLPSFITPARLTAFAGFLTGLGAAVTAALGVVPHDGQVYLVGQEVAGLFVTGASVAKFLEGQAGWEQQQAQHDHEVALTEQKHQQELSVIAESAAQWHRTGQEAVKAPESALVRLEDETAINEPDPTGEVVMAADPSTGEPARLEA